MAVAALATDRLELLSAATADRLHEPYRAAAYPELPELIAAARAAGAHGACLSGAGSTVIAFSQDAATAAALADAMQRRAAELGLTGRAVVHAARSQGAVCEPSTVGMRRRADALA
jgi:homoserine kinase